MIRTLCFLFFILASAHAHEGPPYPILVNHPVEQHKLSIWADPDVGEGSFQFYLEDGTPDAMAKLAIEVVPITPEGVANPGVLAKRLDNDKLDALIPFAVEGYWHLQLIVRRDGAIISDSKIEVEVTPPGPSKTEFLIYLFPFVVVGFIWFKVLRVKYKKKGSPK